jgi:hypothetical protein
MDAISLQEAKKAQKRVGNLKELHTDTKANTVAAINELKSELRKGMATEVIETELYVDSGQTVESWMNFMSSGFITGIKVTGSELTGEFYFKIYTKPPADGGTYVYYSGKIVNILWDVPENDIPFFDESGQQQIYLVLQNNGAPTNFKIQIFVLKG